MSVRHQPKSVFGFSRNGRSSSPKYTLFVEAAFLADHRRKQINGTVNPAANAAQKSIASTGERNSGVLRSLLRAALDQGGHGRPSPNTRNMSSVAGYHWVVVPVRQGTTRCMALRS